MKLKRKTLKLPQIKNVELIAEATQVLNLYNFGRDAKKK